MKARINPWLQPVCLSVALGLAASIVTVCESESGKRQIDGDYSSGDVSLDGPLDGLTNSDIPPEEDLEADGAVIVDGQDGDIGEDDDMLGADDHDAPTDVVIDGWWEHDSSGQCTTVDEGFERHRDGALSPDAPPTPQLLWQQRTGCENIDSAWYDVLATPTAIINVDDRMVVVTTVENANPNDGSLDTYAVAYHELSTGALVDCVAVPEPMDWYALQSRTSFSSTSAGATLPRNARSGEASQLLTVSRTAPVQVHELPEVESIASYAPVGERLAVVTETSSEGFRVFDLVSHQLAWSGDGRSIQATPRWLSAASNNPLEAGYLRAYNLCGDEIAQLSVSDGLLANPMWLGDYLFLSLRGEHFSGIVVLDASLNELGRVPDCESMVTWTDDSVACLRRSVPGKVDIIEAMPDGSEHSLAMIDTSDSRISLQHWLVAGGEGHAVLGMSLRDKGGKPAGLRLLIIGPDQAIESIDVMQPDSLFVPATAASLPPVIAADGTIVLSRWGELIAIRSNVPGLAKTPYPRGSFGGNENRGYVMPALETP